MDLASFLAEERERIDGALDRLLPAADAWPGRLHEAMRYAVFGGGKRVRPVLARAACRAAGGDAESILESVCALEMVHTYSLIHDDLPALDDDTLRRGRATVHVAFDEALAILAGDALLTEAFVVLGRFPDGHAFASRRADACRVVAEAIGSRGMVGGQVEDLEATRAAPDGDRLRRIHGAKTGALLGAAAELGALLAGASAGSRAAFALFGRRLGLLFQVVDDILDATGSAASLGKSPGKDAAAGKLTYPAVYGLDATRRERDALAGSLGEEAQRLEGGEGTLSALVAFVARRDR
ncbi:MAG: polyprenyl synthetase family protein [Acidobacteriia bacterium]|nr:polyprenyl synthetase family protein [Terriglobia bacterium]